MAQMVVIYSTPKDPAAFDKHYFETHVPLAKKIAGLRKYEVSRGPVATLPGASGVHMIATLHFDDLVAIQNARAKLQDGRKSGRGFSSGLGRRWRHSSRNKANAPAACANPRHWRVNSPQERLRIYEAFKI
jgi:uncharacterized protein (TIGR02118 family)